MFAALSTLSTRDRLLAVALLRFRQRGYHGVGINEILAEAQAPKGSLYHHFPGGKPQLAREVIERVTQGLLEWLGEGGAPLHDRVLKTGGRIAQWMRETAPGDGPTGCALLAGFATDLDTEPEVREAASRAYGQLSERLRQGLVQDGWPPARAATQSLIVLSLLEGSGLIAQTLDQPELLAAAARQAARLCLPPSP